MHVATFRLKIFECSHVIHKVYSCSKSILGSTLVFSALDFSTFKELGLDTNPSKACRSRNATSVDACSALSLCDACAVFLAGAVCEGLEPKSLALVFGLA